MRHDMDGTFRPATHIAPPPPATKTDAWSDAVREGEKIEAELRAGRRPSAPPPDPAAEDERQRHLTASHAERDRRGADVAERWSAAVAEGDAALAAILAQLEGWEATRTLPTCPPPERVADVLGEAWVGLWRVRLLRGHGGGMCLERDRMDEAHATYFTRAGT
jgi:hypothetical protein